MALDTVAARSKRRRLPVVDAPRVSDDELRRNLEAIREHLRMYEGDSGAPKERFVTIEELEKAGLIGTKVQGNFALIDSVLGGDVAQGQQAGGGQSSTIIINEGGGGGATTLAELADTNVEGAAANSFLQLVNGQWIGRRLFGIENTWTALNTFRNCLRIAGIDAGYVEFCHDNTDLNITHSSTAAINFSEIDLTVTSNYGINWTNSVGGDVENLLFGPVLVQDAIGTIIVFTGQFDGNEIDVCRSTDGGETYTQIDWGTSRRPSSNGYVVYSRTSDTWLHTGTFVFGGGAIGMTSADDGLTWSPLIPTGTAGVDYPNVTSNSRTVFVEAWNKVKVDGWVASMTDLDSWTLSTGWPAASYEGFAYSPTLNIAVQAAGAGSSALYWSTDEMASWTAGTNLGKDCIDVEWLPNHSLFLALPSTTGSNNVFTSTDGKVWTTVTDVLGGNQNRQTMAYSPTLDIVVAVGTTGARAIWSDDAGQSWTAATTDLPSGWTDYQVLWDAQHGWFLCYERHNGSDLVYKSTDGKNWTATTTPLSGGFGTLSVGIGYSQEYSASAEGFVVGDPAYPTQIDGTTTTITGATQLDTTLNVDGATTLGSTLNVTGLATFDDDIKMADLLGDRITLYGTHDAANTWAIGIEGNTQYYKSNSIFRWYIGVNADAGVSDTMELTSTDLQLNADLNVQAPNDVIVNADLQQWNNAAGQRYFEMDELGPGGSQRMQIDVPIAIQPGITNRSSLYIHEQAAAVTDFANYGQWWVLTATPNIPMFTDDAGGDGTLARLEYAQTISGIWQFNANLRLANNNAIAARNAADTAWVNGLFLDGSDIWQVGGGNTVRIEGDLIVAGTTTTVNSETLTIDDNIITLNNNVTGVPTENSGIEVERGTSTNVLLRYNETADRWEFTNDGTTYYNIPISTEYTTDHTALSNIGTNTHAQIDSHIGDGTIHFTQGAISIPLSQINDVTATAAEVNLLDLAGLTVGWVLSADTATTASWKAPELVRDLSPQLGGSLDTNDRDINFRDGNWANFGTGGDVILQWDGTDFEVSQALSNQVWNWRDQVVMRWYEDLDTNYGQITYDDIFKITTNTGAIQITPGGTANVSLGNFTFDADQVVGVGQDNYVLTYDNATGLVSLEAVPAGGTIGGTIADNQVAVGNGTDAIDGSANLTWDGSTFDITGAINVSGQAVFTKLPGSADANDSTLTLINNQPRLAIIDDNAAANAGRWGISNVGGNLNFNPYSDTWIAGPTILGFLRSGNDVSIASATAINRWEWYGGMDMWLRDAGQFLFLPSGDNGQVQMGWDGSDVDFDIAASGTLVATDLNITGFSGDLVAGNYRFDMNQSLAGADNYVLTYDSVGGKISLEAIPGGGTIGGTIADNQVAIGNGTDAIDGSANFTWDGSTVSVTGAISVTGTARGLYANNTGAYLQIGGSSTGYAASIGARQHTDSAALQYGTYWAYDAYWDDSADNWVAMRTTLGRKWLVEMGYHQDEFNIRRYDGVVTSPWADSAWEDLFTVTTAGARVSSTAPFFELFDSNGPVDEKRFRWRLDAGNFILSKYGDDQVLDSNAMQVISNGTQVDYIDLIASNDVNILAASLDVHGKLFLEETAAAAADRTGFGQLWVSSTDSHLYFTTDGGTDYQVSGAGGTIGGSITDNQIAVGAATADSIEGSAALTWNGSVLTTTGRISAAPSGANPALTVSPRGTGVQISSYATLSSTYSNAHTVLGNNVYVDTTDVVSGQVRHAVTHASYGHTIYEMAAGVHYWYGQSANVTQGTIVTKNAQAQLDNDGFRFLEGVGANTAPGADNLLVNGYGIMGNRSANPVYVTNANATGTLAFNTGGVHGSGNNRMTISNTIIDALVDFRVRGGNDLIVYDSGNDDFLNVSHSGTLVTFATAGTGQGGVPINFDVSRVEIGNNGSNSDTLRIGDATHTSYMDLYNNSTDSYLNYTGIGSIRITHLSEDMIVCVSDGQVTLYYDAIAQLNTQSYSANGNTSGGEIRDHQGTYRDIGFNDLKPITITADTTLNDEHVGSGLIKTVSTAGIDLILPSVTTQFPVNSVTQFMNAGNSTVTINASTNTRTLYWLDGSTRTGGASTNRTIAYGGVITIWRQSSTTYYIWGSGIS